VAIPVILLLVAGLLAGVMAYGAHPAWARFGNGFEAMLLVRQYQWVIGAASVVLCLLLVGLIVSGRRRAWWLIGLGPILALFLHRFQTDPLGRFAILEEPTFVSATDANFMSAEDYVVGLVFAGNAYAYPYHALYPSPVVVQIDRGEKLILVWSAFANHATAFRAAHDLKSRDLEIFSMPANALVLYNTRLGEFINGLTGLTTTGAKPSGLIAPIQTERVKWEQWQARHPQTRVLLPAAGAQAVKLPNGPVWPVHPVRGAGQEELRQRVAVLATTRPVAIESETVGPGPVQVSTPSTAVLLMRETLTGRLRAFDRNVGGADLSFRVNTDARRKGAALIDDQTRSGWSADGVALDGKLSVQKAKLKEIGVEDGLYWGVMKHWRRDLQLVGIGK
jgi:Protein of unknown function (DUF3179)